MAWLFTTMNALIIVLADRPTTPNDFPIQSNRSRARRSPSSRSRATSPRDVARVAAPLARSPRARRRRSRVGVRRDDRRARSTRAFPSARGKNKTTRGAFDFEGVRGCRSKPCTLFAHAHDLNPKKTPRRDAATPRVRKPARARDDVERRGRGARGRDRDGGDGGGGASTRARRDARRATTRDDATTTRDDGAREDRDRGSRRTTRDDGGEGRDGGATGRRRRRERWDRDDGD